MSEDYYHIQSTSNSEKKEEKNILEVILAKLLQKQKQKPELDWYGDRVLIFA